jgi:site-specific recombinase XerD
LTTISEALAAYRISARAEGKSPKTIRWIEFSMRYFAEYLGGDQDITAITGDDLKRFIIALQQSRRLRNHPYAKPQPQNLSPETVQTYARGVKACFGQLHRDGLIDTNPMQKIKMPKVPRKIVPTFSDKDIEKLLSQANKQTDRGFRDYSLLLTFVDTAAHLSEIANLNVEDIDLNNGYLKVMGKGSKERYIPIGHKVQKALLKYKLKHRSEPIGTDRFFLTIKGGPMTAQRIQNIIGQYGKKAGLKRCYAHKIRHTSSVMYLRNGGDPFSLQKKLGHSSLSMTRHYSNLADGDVKAQHLRYGVADRLRI